MTIKDVYNRFISGETLYVKFTRNVEVHEGVIDDGMIARLHKMIIEDEGIYRITFDLNEYEAHNDRVSKDNFYDDKGVPCLTAKEAGEWPENGREWLYFTEDSEIYEFDFIDNLDREKYE